MARLVQLKPDATTRADTQDCCGYRSRSAALRCSDGLALRAAAPEKLLNEFAAVVFAHAADDFEAMIVAGQLAAAHR